MESKIQVPNNIEDKTVLKRFLTQLVLGINGNPLFSGNVVAQNQALVNILQTNPNVDFLNVVSKLNELRTDILTYVEENVETIILQQQEDIAVIAEQFGTFYQQSLAASWYGLSVKAGGAVAGLEVGSLDPDVTTPGDENSYFRVIADNFIVGRAYEDLTQEEKDYLAANNLPNFGTVYNAQKQPVPALITSWDNISGTYKHYFNGIVQFSNIQNADYANAINNGTTTINGGKITTSTLEANVLKPASSGTTVWSGGALVSQNFNGNAVGNIGTPTQGFRLSSNAVGTTMDPNIYGAYIKGSTIEGSTVNVTDLKVQSEGYPGKFGPIYRCFNVDSNQNALVGPNFIGSYLDNRICSYSKTSVKIECWYRARGNYVSCVLEYALTSDPNTWFVIADRSAQMYGYLDFMYLSFSEFFNVNLIPASYSICKFRIRATSGNDYSFSPILITLSNG